MKTHIEHLKAKRTKAEEALDAAQAQVVIAENKFNLACQHYHIDLLCIIYDQLRNLINIGQTIEVIYENGKLTKLDTFGNCIYHSSVKPETLHTNLAFFEEDDLELIILKLYKLRQDAATQTNNT